MSIRGVIFDLDGTLVDSALDFDLMRREMGLPQGLPILEALSTLGAEEARRRWQILARHELEGVERATLFPGVREFLAELARRDMRRAVLTRNSSASTLATLARFELEIHTIHARDDGPAKPDPSGIWRICETWGLRPAECVMIGDYRFDIEAGRRAGTRTVLFTGSGKSSGMAAGDSADVTLASFAQPQAFWALVDQIDLGAR